MKLYLIAETFRHLGCISQHLLVGVTFKIVTGSGSVIHIFTLTRVNVLRLYEVFEDTDGRKMST